MKRLTEKKSLSVGQPTSITLWSEVQDEYGIKLIAYFCHIPLVVRAVVSESRKNPASRSNQNEVRGPDLEKIKEEKKNNSVIHVTRRPWRHVNFQLTTATSLRLYRWCLYTNPRSSQFKVRTIWGELSWPNQLVILKPKHLPVCFKLDIMYLAIRVPRLSDTYLSGCWKKHITISFFKYIVATLPVF